MEILEHSNNMRKLCNNYKTAFKCAKIILIPRLHDTTGCQTGCQTGLTTGLTTVLKEQPLFVQPAVKPGCTTGLTTGCIVYTNIQPVVKPVWQQVVSCKRGLTGITCSWRNRATCCITANGKIEKWSLDHNHDHLGMIYHSFGDTWLTTLASVIPAIWLGPWNLAFLFCCSDTTAVCFTIRLFVRTARSNGHSYNCLHYFSKIPRDPWYRGFKIIIIIIIIIRTFITRTCSQALSINRRRGQSLGG